MTQNKTPPHTKLDERNHVEKSLLTGKTRVTALLNDMEVAGV